MTVSLTESARTSQPFPKTTVVIPTLNEAENLPHVIPWIPSWVDEIIVVDGASTDGTPEVARSLRANVRVVQQQGKGKGAALRTGFDAARGSIIVMLDADGSTDPTEIPAYVGALLAGADFAKGSRFLQGGGTSDMPLYRKLGNWFFVLCVRLLFGGAYTDLCYGYNAFWKHVLPKLSLDGNGFEIETMMNVRALKEGLSITEVPSFEAQRVHGEGRLRAFPDGWRVLKTIAREWYHQRVRKPTQTPASLPREDDTFIPTLRLLTREAYATYQQRDNLSSGTYQQTAENIQTSFGDLLNMNVTSLEARRLREQYRKFSDNPWTFMELRDENEARQHSKERPKTG